MAATPNAENQNNNITIKLFDSKGINGSDIQEQVRVCAIIDEFGLKSAQAQSIKNPMTTSSKFKECDHRIYIAFEDTIPCGFIRVGGKHLYYYDKKGKCSEIDPLCCLDFYVSESFQRKGIGKSLINHMLEAENIEIQKIAWDKPTEKSISLLSKHYNLNNFIPNPNNYVVFDEFFV